MAKPGVIFYFEIRPCIKRLSLEEKGRLFEAILDYGEFGIVPDLDGMAGIAWDFIQPKLDRDAYRYDSQVEQKKYAVFVQEIKKRGNTHISFEEWKSLSDTDRNRLLSADCVCYPNPNSQTTNPNSQTKPEGKADKPPTRHCFTPPTVDEVRAYCTGKGYTVDADRFVDYYTSNGWRVGKNPMKDWKAAVRTWNGKEQSNNGKTESKPLWTIGTVV